MTEESKPSDGAGSSSTVTPEDTTETHIIAAENAATRSFGRRVGNPVEGERDSAVKPNTIPL